MNNNYIDYTIKFKEIIEYGKKLKSDIIYINNNIIYGTDTSFSYLKTLSVKNDIGLNILYIQKDMNNFIKDSTDTIIYSDNTIQSVTSYMVVNNPNYIVRFTNLIDQVQYLLNFEQNLIIGDVREYKGFESLINLKSTQGMGLFKAEGYILTLFKNLLPINKNDRVGLTIRDISEDRFLATFSIMKSKDINVFVNIMYLKIK